MVLPIAEGRRYAIGSAQGTPFIDFLGFHCVLKRTVLELVLFAVKALLLNLRYGDYYCGSSPQAT